MNGMLLFYSYFYPNNLLSSLFARWFIIVIAFFELLGNIGDCQEFSSPICMLIMGSISYVFTRRG
jgi:hypothetical protein